MGPRVGGAMDYCTIHSCDDGDHAQQEILARCFRVSPSAGMNCAIQGPMSGLRILSLRYFGQCRDTDTIAWAEIVFHNKKDTGLLGTSKRGLWM